MIALPTYLQGPRVLAIAREHFGCDALDGVEIENQPTSNGACWGSHWEERLFKTEFMSAIVDVGSSYSALTLGFFEDSGWYKANYSHVQHLAWGYKKGCGFAQGPCLGAPKANPVPSDPEHFCSINGQEGTKNPIY